ncbi:outer membrane protein assembly factor BamB, contains PQQ-like beta-propeller repeat [Bacteroidales bacterium 6E]|nr:outer membrane protein assembly factor BamB, contains PQQ-like beta-propeller repeat [Bacteroidales bacterium 6E]
MKTTIILFVTTTFVFLGIELFGQNDNKWNGWRGPGRDGRVSGFTVPETWPGQLNRKWLQTVGLGDASPVLFEGRIYLHTRKNDSETALCIDAETGRIIWEEVNNPAPEVTGGAASHPGPRSTPAIAGGRVFNLGAGGNFTCRDTQTGQLIWRNDEYTDEVPQFFVACSPLVLDNKVIVHLGGKEKGTVVAFSLSDGSKIWELKGESSTYSSPILMRTYDNLLVVQGENDLLGISVDKGELLWKFNTPTSQRFYNSSTPVISGKTVYIAGQGTGMRALGVERENNGFVVKEAWVNPEAGVSFNTPVIKDGFLYANDARFGNIFCVNAQSGATAWIDTTKHNRFASLLDLGAIMATLPATGQLIFYKPESSAYHEVMAYKVAETEVYAHPVFAGNRIFVKDKENLICWEF